MFVYRIENAKGHGPIWGKKSSYYEDFDYRGTLLGDNLKKMNPEMSDEEAGLFGKELIETSFDSRGCIRKHKTPRENKPYFYNRFGLGNYFDYRFGTEYFFGYTSFKKALEYVKPGRKNSMTLQKEGFHIVVYNVNNGIIFPDGQIAFKKNKASFVMKYKNVYGRMKP